MFKLLTAPLEVLADENGNVTRPASASRWSWASRTHPAAAVRSRSQGSEFVIDLDCVIAAIGTSPNPLIRHTTPGLETQPQGLHRRR